MKYYIYIIYEDESEYIGIINNKKDFNNVPKDKKYETIKIMYDNKYGHVLYGHDYIYIGYKKGIIEYAKWTDKIINVIQMYGINKEKIITNIKSNKIKPTFTGKQLPDEQYEKLRLKCHNWRYE